MQLKKSQGAIEFMIIIGAVLFFFVIFFTLINERVSQSERDKEMTEIKNLALSVQDEINLATKSTDGYNREFYVPQTINLNEYYINMTDSRIYIKTEGNAISYPIEKVEGQIKKGNNRIKKENGKVYLN